MSTTSSTQTPGTVTAAFWILLLGLILDAIGAILLVVGGIALVGRGDAGGMAAGLGAPVLIGAAVIALLFVVIELIIVFKMRGGRNWARIVITILEVLGLGSLFTNPTFWSWGAVVLSLIAVVLMWLPASNAYFRRS